MTAPDGWIRIPLNEEKSEQVGQIEEYREYNGEGIQHIAFHVDLVMLGPIEGQRRAIYVRTPETYYDMLEERLEGTESQRPMEKARYSLG